MKLIGHYLKFDFLRWRGLFGALWALALAYVVLMAAAASPTDHPQIFASVRIIAGLIVLTMASLCYQLGAADAPIRNTAWTRTRPHFLKPLLLARVLLLGLLVVVPIVGAHAATLAAMRFEGSEIIKALPLVLGTVGCWVVVFALWGFLKPCFPGFVVGSGVGLLLGAFLVYLLQDVLKIHRMASLPGHLLGLMTLTPMLLGLYRLRKPMTHRVWAKQGFQLGFLLGMLHLGLPWLVAWNQHRRETSRFETDKFIPTLQVPIEGIRSLGTRNDAALEMKFPPLTDDLWMPAPSALTIHCVSWKTQPGEAWAPWVPMKIRVNPELDQITCFDPLPEMSNGELRLGIRSEEQQLTQLTSTYRAGMRLSGPGWNLEVNETESPDHQFLTERVVRRSLPTDPTVTWKAELAGSGTRSLITGGRAELPFLHLEFLRSEPPRSDEQSHPRELAISTELVPAVSHRILHLTGITVRRKSEQPDPRKLAPVEPRSTPSRHVATPTPWVDFNLDEVPSLTATEAEIAQYLQMLTEAPDGGRGDGFPPWKHTQLKALVAKWLPLFLEFAARYPNSQTQEIMLALRDGTPESRRGELIQSLPRAPQLIKILQYRGWLREAKPFLIETLQQETKLPPKWNAVLSDLRDPDFHPFLRQNFQADEATVRYWQSMPDLATELPARLEAIKHQLRLQGIHQDEKALWGLIAAGDSYGIEMLLKLWAESAGFRRDSMARVRTYLRDSEGKLAPVGDFTELLRNTTATDWQYLAAHHFWIKIPTAPPP